MPCEACPAKDQLLNGQSATISGLRELIRTGTTDREVADKATLLAAERGRANVAPEGKDR